MLNKLVDIIKEVFWLKKSGGKKKRGSTSARSTSTRGKKVNVRTKTSVKAVKKTTKTQRPLPKTGAKVAVKAAAKTKAVASVVNAAKPVKVASVKVPKIKPPKNPLDPNLVPVGEITHYFERIKVCVVSLTNGTILIGDRLTIATKNSHFTQKVWSMQIESNDVKVAKKGQMIGLKVDKSVTVGDIVYK